MSRIVQICPLGFEYSRVIEGIRLHPSNVIYLLRSIKKEKIKGDPDKKLIEIADHFINSLYKHFVSTKMVEVVIWDTIIVNLEESIEQLCKIIKNEIEVKKAEEIWINISTANKLFVSAAMYVGSFKSEHVRLFYLKTANYTINELFIDSKSKKEIRELFERNGMTFSKEGEKNYRNIDIPLLPAQIISVHAQEILKTLKKLSGNNRKKFINFMDLLECLGEKPWDKTVKMKYGHHLKNLKKRNLILDKIHGRKKTYRLTKEGWILSIIFSYFNSN